MTTRERVRTKTGAPIADDFDSPLGTPIVIDGTATTGGVSYLDDAGTIVNLAPYYVAPVSWTPTFTFATPGDLSVAYSNRHGRIWRIGSMIVAEFGFTLSTFTHTTASGNATISGLTYTAANETDYRAVGSLFWGGITKAGYTDIVPIIFNNTAAMNLVASGSGVGADLVVAADMPSGGTPQFRGSIVFHI